MPVHAGQPDINYRDLRSLLADQFQAAEAIGGHFHLKIFELQKLPQQIPGIVVVFHERDRTGSLEHRFGDGMLEISVVVWRFDQWHANGKLASQAVTPTENGDVAPMQFGQST